MSIAVLTDVYQESRRLAIAGSNLASGDFRLKKLIPQLEKVGEKAPVFVKVAEAVSKVVASDNKTVSQNLLELSTLITAILYTQGQTGAEGKLKPIETAGFDLPSSTSSARVLKPLIEALTTTGSGRLEIIQDAHQRGAFKDVRLVKPAVAAIDDGYPDIADFVSQNVLPIYGRAIIPELQASFDIKGKQSHVRRLQLMHALDPDGTQSLVEEALESGSKEVKVAAIECLKGSEKHLSFLLEQTTAKAKDVRRAALRSIGQLTDAAVVETLIKALSKDDVELAAAPASENRSPKLLTFLLEEGRKQLAEIGALKDKTKLNKACMRFYQFLDAFMSRTDKKSVEFLMDCFSEREDLGKLKVSVGGEEIVLKLAFLMCSTKAKPALVKLIEARDTLSPSALRYSFAAAIQAESPEKVYDLFSPIFLANANGKGASVVKQKQECLRETLLAVHSSVRVAYRYTTYWHHSHLYDDVCMLEEFLQNTKLDPRWLTAAITKDDAFLICTFARIGQKETDYYLAKKMKQILAKKKGDIDFEATEIIRTMIRIEHPEVVDLFLKLLEIQGVRTTHLHYVTWWLGPIIAELPKSAAPKIEALLPKLNEKLIDDFIPHLETLKAKP